MARCIACGYVIEGLAIARCPECARPFDPQDPSTYTRRLPFVRWKFWLPGLGFSLGLGFILFVLFTLVGGFGIGVSVALPTAIGALLGYRVRLGPLTLLLLSLIAAAAFGLGLVSFSFMGLFCGGILAIVFVFPVFIGALLGWGLREGLKASEFSQRGWLPILLFLLVPTIVVLIERTLTPAFVPVRVSSSLTINASPGKVWRALQFYEEVEHDPPLILHLGLPRPQSTFGSMSRVGDRKTCVYDNGRIVKEVTKVDRGHLLEFVVVEQKIGVERSVALRGGSFQLEELGENRTRLSLTTQYDAKLRPRFAWSWAESLAIHALHAHVMEGIRREVEQEMVAVHIEGEVE